MSSDIKLTKDEKCESVDSTMYRGMIELWYPKGTDIETVVYAVGSKIWTQLGADYNEYKISEADFKNLHPNDFEDLYLLHLQGHLNHLSVANKVHLFNAVNMWVKNIIIRKHVEDLQLGIESYQTTLNLTQPDWDASDFLFKEDYTIVSKPRAYNSGMETRIWSKDDRRRSKEFMEVIERRLKIRRIFRSLESFVVGRRSNTYTGNPVKEILLKLNLPDHMSILTDSKVKEKMEMEIPRSSRVNFITTCSYSFNKSKDFMKTQAYISKLSQL
uniref:Uncharacterized protein n=1 Tax=Tanacetum cinerariifolium TaxID=118510 RepID=A0A6L2JVL6_TANCI|nr:hypothetical protein [Tanacetum cinerariifolium]